ncbi:MAG: DUF2059 domain-containing protein [Bacteroidota bacterium]
MKQLLFLFSFSLLSSFAFSQEIENTSSEEFRAKVVRMLELQGTKERFELVLDQMLDLRASYTDRLMPDFANELKTEIKKEGFDELYNLLIPIYQKHLSGEELDAIIAFYESPEGQSLIAKSPLIMQESMQVGAAWGEEIGERIAEKMLDEKYQIQIDSMEILPPDRQ